MHNFLLILVFSVLGCNGTNTPSSENGEVKSPSIIMENTNLSDTTDSIMSFISLARQHVLDSIAKKDTIEFARTVLREFTFCNCLFQSFKFDSAFRKVDQSNGYMIQNEILHSKTAIDSIRLLVENYVSWINKPNDNPTSAKNYTILCLNLYESKYLELLIQRLDKYIHKKD